MTSHFVLVAHVMSSQANTVGQRYLASVPSASVFGLLFQHTWYRCTAGNRVSDSAGQSSMTSMHGCGSWQERTQLRVSWKGELRSDQASVNGHRYSNMVHKTCHNVNPSACVQYECM